MSGEKWKQVNDLFHAALDVAPALRTEFLQQQCQDPSVLEEVVSLLDAHKKADHFIDTPILPHIFELDQDEDELLSSGEVVGPYKILHAIGRGGMGAVYLGVRADEAYQKHVAIKLVKRGIDTGEILRHFRIERQILADFDHPNIARLMDGGTTDSGLPYFVMEYVEGMPIDVYCDYHLLTITERLELFRQVCAAVSYAHRRLVIHRDLKPSNIFVTRDGIAKLLDFGIAKILDTERRGDSTATGWRLMTPEYASPEQALGLSVTTVSDVYSLGVLLYEILTGQSPYQFQNRSPMEMIRVIQDTQPLLPSVVVQKASTSTSEATPSPITARNTSAEHLKRRLRGDLDNIVRMAMRKEPQRRYQSVEQFSEDIRRHLVGLPVIARKDTIVYRLTKFTRRNKIGVAAAVLILLTLIGGVIATTWQAQKARAEQARAEYAKEFGDELRYLESLLMSTYTAPLHDIRPGLKLAQARLRQIEQRMLQAGPWAYAAGHNALGNGYLLLKDYERARTHLEQAWSSGYREPSTAYALGKALGNLYLNSVTSADRVSNKEMRQRLIQEAEQKYATRAVSFLSEARTNAESPVFIEGLIALYQKRLDEAFQKANEALQSSSRPHEVMKLQGDIHFASGRVALDRGDFATGLKSYSLAGEAYARAADSARSDPDIYMADVRLLTRIVSVQEGNAGDLVQKALTYCDRAVQINPDDSRVYLMRAEVYNQQGINQMYQTAMDPRPAFRRAIQQGMEAIQRKAGAAAYDHTSRAYLRIGEYEASNNMDARAALNAAIAEAKKAVAIDPNLADAYINGASAYFYLSEYELNHGMDPTSSLKHIIETYERDLADYPKDTYALNLLALTHMGIAEYGMKRGQDPRPELKKALEYCQEGLQKNQNSFQLAGNMGVLYLDLAKYESSHGLSPDESIANGVRANNQALRLDPDSRIIFNRGLLYLTSAEHKIRVRQDPTSDLQLALNDFRRMRELYPDFAQSMLQTASVALLAARFQFTSGRTPVPDLARAKGDLTQFLTRDRLNTEAYLLLGNVHALSARWELKNGRPPKQSFDQAIVNYRKCLELNRLEISAYVEMASVYKSLAERETGQKREELVDQGIQVTNEGGNIHPEHPEILAIRGTLLMLKRGESGIEGEALLKRALQLNPFLRFDYSALEVARTLADKP